MSGLKLSEKPSPQSIMNSPATWSPGYQHPDHQGAPVYALRQYPVSPTAIFAECAPIRCFPFSRFLLKVFLVCTLGASVIFAAMAFSLLSSPQKAHHAEWVLIGVLSVISGFLFAFIAVVLGIWVRRTGLWPIVIEPGYDQPIVRFAERKQWCELNKLNPELAICKLEYVGPESSALFRPTLPDSIRDDCFGVWLSLSYKNRHRWALLKGYADEESALLGVLEWTACLQLGADAKLSDKHPPEKLQLI